MGAGEDTLFVFIWVKQKGTISDQIIFLISRSEAIEALLCIHSFVSLPVFTDWEDTVSLISHTACTLVRMMASEMADLVRWIGGGILCCCRSILPG